jgi:hypothetical protein
MLFDYIILLNITLTVLTTTNLHPLESLASGQQFKLPSNTDIFTEKCQISSKMNSHVPMPFCQTKTMQILVARYHNRVTILFNEAMQLLLDLCLFYSVSYTHGY